ncbi:unnamed protein product [Symbiodinium sp. CCMP2592]|nr:unnamed protein product [Symbiodinium sp. CCMP2592]
MAGSSDYSDLPTQIRQQLASQRVHQSLYEIDEFADPVEAVAAASGLDAVAEPLVPHAVSRSPAGAGSYPSTFDTARFSTEPLVKAKAKPRPSQAPHVQLAGSLRGQIKGAFRIVRVRKVPRTQPKGRARGFAFLWRGGMQLRKPASSSTATQTDPVPLSPLRPMVQRQSVDLNDPDLSDNSDALGYDCNSSSDSERLSAIARNIVSQEFNPSDND